MRPVTWSSIKSSQRRFTGRLFYSSVCLSMFYPATSPMECALGRCMCIHHVIIIVFIIFIIMVIMVIMVYAMV